MRVPLQFCREFSARIPERMRAARATLLSVLVMFPLSFLLSATVSAAEKLLYSSDLTYIGSFRVPSGSYGADSFDYAGSALAYYPAHNSLFISGNVNRFHVSEISIPTPVDSRNLNNLNTATVIQGFSDPTEGRSEDIKKGGACCIANGVKIGGLIVYQNKLIGTSYSYYDGADEAVRSHYTSGLDLSANDAAGMFELTGSEGASFVSGWMAEIPSVFQSALGATHITGNGSLAVIGRTSWGPSAFAANLGELGSTVPLPVKPLMYYTQDQPSIGRWNGEPGTYQTVWNGTAIIRGVAFPTGSKSILYIGLVGTGPFCYGSGKACGDLMNPYQGTHAYPYIFRIWAYNADDFIAAKNRKKRPWKVLPYSTWELISPFGVTAYMQGGAGGVAYDPTTKRLYISQPEVDSYRPVVNVYSVNVDGAPPSLVPSATN
jgi:hypothetical protein